MEGLEVRAQFASGHTNLTKLAGSLSGFEVKPDADLTSRLDELTHEYPLGDANR